MSELQLPGRLDGRRNVGCKVAATVHFSPDFCPIATAMRLRKAPIRVVENAEPAAR